MVRHITRLTHEIIDRRRADPLSGGQQQRVAIARALVQEPKILLANEPIASLGPMNAKVVMNALRTINQEDQITVVCNLHTLDTARRYCDRVIGMAAGKVRTIRFGILPQVFPVFLPQSLYFLESNTRSATILGIVGAGGIGMINIERFRATLYDQGVFVVVNVLILVEIIDWVSKYVRMKFIGEQSH